MSVCIVHSGGMVTAELIRSARERLGESQAAFGERFGVNQSTVDRWETNGPPSRGTARRVIERFLSENGMTEAETGDAEVTQ